MEAISKEYDKRIQMIVAGVVRVHHNGANGKKGGILLCGTPDVSGLTTKLHAVVDLVVKPVCLKLTAGQAHDGRLARDMLGSIEKGRFCWLKVARAIVSKSVKRFSTLKNCYKNK